MGNSVQFSGQPPHRVVAIACAVALLVPAYSPTYAQQDQPLAADQLDSLVAPVALYPDPLLAQTLAASTYPLEVIQLQQWMANNSYLRDQALADAVEKQPWDPSVQALATFPDVVKLLSDNIAWMTDLGNAFLAQQGDVMDAVQRMRARAQSNGNLNTTPQQTVQMQTVEGGEQAIVIEPADPGMVYVPAYDPTVVYGSSAYAYPTLYYASPAYYRAGGALAFGAGVALGAAWGGNWGYGCKWANGDININYNNKYVSNSNKNRNINYGNRASQQPAGGTWQHNSQHRGGAPYADRRTANKYAARSGIQAAAAGTNRSFSGLNAGNPGINRAGGGAGFSNGVGAGAGAPIRPGGVGGDRIANRNVSPNLGAANAFGSAGFNGNSVRASTNRGNNSFGGAGAGRGARGGGGGGGRRR
ncbi:MAG TPA: DUF3300 domain-containing protein [Candidatus Udaeobacter sp.]|jgi:hypothetical protein|nr:DUF3300 domain-containing protein [Candidatus Udaeobacter sp.]